MNIRQKIIETSYKAGACHIGSALSCVEILEAIYETKKKEDIFIFAKASGVCAVYCRECPRRAVDYLKRFPLPTKGRGGLIWSGGSLGMGLSVASGLALTGKRVYVLMSDGELQEGQTWEAVMFASHHKLPVTVVVDRNGLQALGESEIICKLDNLLEKFWAFGWVAVEVDGHNVEELKDAIKNYNCGLPKVIIANTTKGKGVDFMENNYEWHYKNLDEEGYKKAILQLDTKKGS